MLKNLIIFGVGLIGGSFAQAFKKANPETHIIAVLRNESKHLETLSTEYKNVIDTVYFQKDANLIPHLKTADLILISVPVFETENILQFIAPHINEQTTITDAGSTKSNVITMARHTLGDKVKQFIPGHPIAGREKNGPQAALADLYVNKKVILTPLPENQLQPSHLNKVRAAWESCHAMVYELDPKEHDHVFATVSHLPHLLSYALVNDITSRQNVRQLFEYAGSGFRDFTRIAASSAQMWHDITLSNKDALLDELDQYIQQLTILKKLITHSDSNALLTMYSNAQRARQEWEQTNQITHDTKKST
jgi:prephenate dehydrogenase